GLGGWCEVPECRTVAGADPRVAPVREPDFGVGGVRGPRVVDGRRAGGAADAHPVRRGMVRATTCDAALRTSRGTGRVATNSTRRAVWGRFGGACAGLG